MQNNSNDQIILACNIGAIAPEQRAEHGNTAKDIFAAVLEITEATDGYAFRLPLETPMLHKTIQWIANERLCCPFFTFTIEIGEQLWVKLSGSAEVKAFIQATVISTIQEPASNGDQDL